MPISILFLYQNNSCYYSWACRQNLFCLQLHPYEAKGSIQWEKTHSPRLSVKTAGNCNNSYCRYLCAPVYKCLLVLLSTLVLPLDKCPLVCLLWFSISTRIISAHCHCFHYFVPKINIERSLENLIAEPNFVEICAQFFFDNLKGIFWSPILHLWATRTVFPPIFKFTKCDRSLKAAMVA